MLLLLITGMVKDLVYLGFIKRVKVGEFVWLGVFLFLLVASAFFYLVNHSGLAGRLLEITALFVLLRLVIYIWRFRQPDHK